GLVVRGPNVLVSDSANHVRVAVTGPDGNYKWGDPTELTKPKMGVAYPTGLALGGGGVWVASSRGNSVQRLDTAAATVAAEVAVGVAPYGIVAVGPDRLYVTNWGGDLPKEGDPRALSSGTAVRVDPRTNVADHGSVSVVANERGGWKQVKSIEVGLHP